MWHSTTPPSLWRARISSYPGATYQEVPLQLDQKVTIKICLQMFHPPLPKLLSPQLRRQDLYQREHAMVRNGPLPADKGAALLQLGQKQTTVKKGKKNKQLR